MGGVGIDDVAEQKLGADAQDLCFANDIHKEYAPPKVDFSIVSIAQSGKKVKRELIFAKKCDILELSSKRVELS
jgi:hypothetical protein